MTLSQAKNGGLDGGLSRHDAIAGLMLCLVFCVAAVVVRGVRWDETWEYAQTMTGAVPYPAGHPLLRYLFGAYSLPNYLSAAMLRLGLGPTLICGFRNVLFLFATTAPVFLITSVLARNRVLGAAAALFALEGIYLEFDGSYPLMTWPELYSNGHIGGGYALLCLGLLMADLPAAAFFLAGLMPCIHVGQVPPLFIVMPGFLLCKIIGGNRNSIKHLLAWGLAGLSIAVVFLVVQKGLFTIPAPAAEPYVAQGDPDALWRSYTAYHDIHRRPPTGNGEVALIALMLLSAAALYVELRNASKRSRPLALVLAYALTVAAIVWSILAIHSVLGMRIPFLLIGWMPYRLLNHTTPLLLCVAMGILGTRRKKSWPLIFIAFGIIYYLVLPLLPHLVGHAIWSRYLAKGDGLFFALCGAAFGALIAESPSKKMPFALSAVCIAALATYHHFGAACVALGLTLALLASVRPPRFAARTPIVTALCFILAVVIFAHEWSARRSLPSSEFDRSISQYLREHNQPGAMLAGPPDEFMLQARTGHPVFCEAATASYLTYMPELGPVFQKMLGDVYGFRLDLKGGEQPVSWQDLWRARSRDEWRRLAASYSFRYVISDDSIRIDLPEVLRARGNVLYAVPD